MLTHLESFPPSSPPSAPSPQAQSLATRPKFQPRGLIPKPWLKSRQQGPKPSDDDAIDKAPELEVDDSHHKLMTIIS